MACLFTLYFCVGLASCSQGGFYFFQLLDRYAAGYSMLVAVFFEAVVVSWIYGKFFTQHNTFIVIKSFYMFKVPKGFAAT